MKKILIFLSNGIEILEVAPFIDIFGWNSVVGDKKEKIKVETMSFGKIKSTWNLSIETELNFETKEINIEEYNALVIPGGFGMAGFFIDGKKEKIQNLIREFYKKNKMIIGICTGAIILGEAGILKNKKATTYFLDNKRYFNQLKKFGAIEIEKDIVRDENIITSANPKSALEVAFYLLEILTSKENSQIVKYNMGYKF
ncbi:DJ-1/PfpI family protein [Fusobacterium perfoetens]|uniref:DJ-1/PfpI family protein n=1 Tax=Fusobacterium perfoetens TaxID=852 RepID=UPI00047FC801|nr:DJ-1/PfpI family protein [Fusobacterium perfoetens]MCI6153106.1 DJ-1/PfpI family protein [Fusobacterium perfoetens]MDY3236918.1 DJ-1/PfpI family protein [Fusobacterium perfoetens]